MSTLTEHPAPPDTIDLATRRRAEILYGSIRVIARDGVVAAKLKDIARESGVSLGLIQHYFDTRENLVDATFGAMMSVISRESAARLQHFDDPVWLIFAMNHLHVYGTVAFPERWGFWSELWAASGRSTHLRSVATQVYQLWTLPIETALHELANTNRLPAGADPSLIANGILALMDGLSIRSIAEPEKFTPAFMLQVLNEWVTTQLRADQAAVQPILEALPNSDDMESPSPLTPELIAAALMDAQ